VCKWMWCVRRGRNLVTITHPVTCCGQHDGESTRDLAGRSSPDHGEARRAAEASLCSLYGPVRPDVNRYLKWAFIEAANAICLTRGRTRRRHVSRLYERVARRKGHAKAIGAVARHLAEATYWLLRNGEAYREPKAFTSVRPRGISAEAP
jgi:hypothetical protein